MSSYKAKAYDVIVFRAGAWRLANPAFFNMSGMNDCRQNDSRTAWLCQIDGYHNKYEKAFIVAITGHFTPKQSQLKQINGTDILIGAVGAAMTSRGSSKSPGSADDAYEYHCRAAGKEPGNC